MVIQAYATTNHAEEAEVERFYEDLQDVLELIPKKDVLFMIGAWKVLCQLDLISLHWPNLLYQLSFGTVIISYCHKKCTFIPFFILINFNLFEAESKSIFFSFEFLAAILLKFLFALSTAYPRFLDLLS